jgi:cytochrome P450
VTTARVVYNIFLHPLRNVPGPLLWGAIPLPWAWHMVHGDFALTVHGLHQVYGPVVRTRPNELSFATAQAWKDIYGLRTKATSLAVNRPRELPKFLRFYKPLEKDANSIITMSRERHGAMRASLAHGFSERSMQAQEPTLLRFVDLLIEKLRERVTPDDETNKKAVNIMHWFNYATFDVISELTYGESFRCLEDDRYHEMPRLLFDNNSISARTRTLRVLGVPSFLQNLSVWLNSSLRGIRKRNRDALMKRLAMGEERDHDFTAGLIKEQRNGTTFTLPEIQMTSNTLIIAGSETTATLLTAVTYLLLTHPDAMAKATAEIRSSFASDEEITVVSVNKLKYTIACLSEALRRYPPVPIGLPREVPEGGDVIDGVPVPAGTAVSVTQYATNHSASNWTDPLSYHPERWLGDERFKADKLDSMQPFSVGPRNCIGKNLAYAEMRIILAKTLYNFDLELAPESRNWIEGQRAFAVWQKPPLNVYLRPAAKAL